MHCAPWSTGPLPLPTSSASAPRSAAVSHVLRHPDREFPVAVPCCERRDRARQGAPGAVRVRRRDPGTGEHPHGAVRCHEHVVGGRSLVVAALRQHQDVPPRRHGTRGIQRRPTTPTTPTTRQTRRRAPPAPRARPGSASPGRPARTAHPSPRRRPRRATGHRSSPPSPGPRRPRVAGAPAASPSRSRTTVGGAEHPDLHRVDRRRRPTPRRAAPAGTPTSGTCTDRTPCVFCATRAVTTAHAVPVVRGDRLEVGLQPGTARRVGPGDAQHARDAHDSPRGATSPRREERIARREPPRLRPVAGSRAPRGHVRGRRGPGSAAAQMPETIATPAAPAARSGATSSSVTPPIATHGTSVAAASRANPSWPSAGGWSAFVVVGCTTPTPSRSTVPRGSRSTAARCASVFAVRPDVGVRSEQRTGGGDGHVGLAEVHARDPVSRVPCGEDDVEPVVDHHPRAVPDGVGDRGGQGEQVTRRGVLVPHLHDPDPGVHGGADDPEHPDAVPVGQGAVGHQVDAEPRRLQLAHAGTARASTAGAASTVIRASRTTSSGVSDANRSRNSGWNVPGPPASACRELRGDRVHRGRRRRQRRPRPPARPT